MGIFDFVKKKKSDPAAGSSPAMDVSSMLDNVDTSKLGFKEKMALKMFKKMSPQKQQQVMQEMMNPLKIQQAIRSGKIKKEDMLKQINEMVKNGQINKGQAEAVKSQLGLR